jgi:hypothetical protein
VYAGEIPRPAGENVGLRDDAVGGAMVKRFQVEPVPGARILILNLGKIRVVEVQFLWGGVLCPVKARPI